MAWDHMLASLSVNATMSRQFLSSIRQEWLGPSLIELARRNVLSSKSIALPQFSCERNYGPSTSNLLAIARVVPTSVGFILLAGEGHDLDLVAIRVTQERSVVVRIVFRSYARRSLIRPAMGKTGFVTGSHSSALSCVEGEVRPIPS